MTPPHEAPGAPTPRSRRLPTLDVLRGFALLGILVMNVQSFSMISTAYMNPRTAGSIGDEQFHVWVATHVLADQKFMTIFSILFGAGIVLASRRVEARGESALALHARRMGWLMVFGLLHAYLLWWGDILFLYGVCGLVVWPLRGLSPRALIIASVLSLAIGAGFQMLWGAALQFSDPTKVAALVAEGWSVPPERAAEEIAAYRGGWLDQEEWRAPASFQLQTKFLLVWGLWRAGGLMLLGMALFRLGLLRALRPARLYAGIAAVCLPVGWTIVIAGVLSNEAAGWDFGHYFLVGAHFNYWGSVLVSLGAIATLVLLWKLRIVRWLLEALADVGRLAFTNYIMQTVICTTIFYGHGLGLFERVSRSDQLLIVAGVWAFQIAFSIAWLRVFRHGPLEWVWRSLAYRRRQRLLR